MFARPTSEYPRMTLNDSRVLASIDGWRITAPDLGSAVHDIDRGPAAHRDDPRPAHVDPDNRLELAGRQR